MRDIALSRSSSLHRTPDLRRLCCFVGSSHLELVKQKNQALSWFFCLVGCEGFEPPTPSV